MDGHPFNAMASAASIASDGIARSAFLAAAKHFLSSQDHSLQPNRLKGPSRYCSSCRACSIRSGLFGAGLVVARRREKERALSAEKTHGQPSSKLVAPKSSRLFHLGCGTASLAAATFGSSKILGANRGGRNRSSRREWHVDDEKGINPVQELLGPFLRPGRFWTNALLLANIIVFAAQWATGGNRMVIWGAKINELIDQGQFWRFITANFLHSNTLHLMMNCYSLNNVGPVWEKLAGGRRFLTVYSIASLTTVLFSYRFSAAPSVGASGAIFGLVGALTVFAYRTMRLFRDGEGRELFDALVRTVAVNALLGLSIQRVDNWSHLGGLLGGAAVGWLLGPAYEVNYYAGLMIDRPPLKRLLEQFDGSKAAKGDSTKR